MNETHTPGGRSEDIDVLRRRLEVSLRRSEAAHRETVRITNELLARLHSRVPGPEESPRTPERYRPESWPTAGPVTAGPVTTASPPPLPPPPSTPAPALGPVGRFLEDKDKVTLGVSVLGGVITVIGLVFLAVQAFSRGWLGPASAVSGAAVLCLLLILGGFAVHRRSPDGPTAAALVSAGVLGMFTDLWVLVFGLGWLDPGLGVVLVAAIASAGMITAWSWSRQPLAVVLLLAGAGFLTPAVLHLLQVTDSSRFDALSLIAVALTGAATTLHREWKVVSLSSAAVFSLGAAVLFGDGQLAALTGSALVGTALMCLLAASTPPQSAALAAVSRWIPVSTFPTVLLSDAAGSLEVTATTISCLAVAGAPVAYAAGRAVVTRISLRTQVSSPEHADPRVASLQAALCSGIAGIVAVLMIRQDDPYVTGALWWMVALTALSTVLLLLSDHLPVPLVWIVFALTLAYALPRAVPAWGGADVSPALMWPVLVLLAVPGGLALARSRSLGATREISLALAALLLVLVTSAIPLIFVTVSDTDVAFMAGHLVTSVTWMGLGVAMLIRDNGASGLALALLAAAKLVFFDLSALAGLIQVAAFIICGAILLGAAILRERRRPAPATPPGTDRSEQVPEERPRV